MMKRFAQAITFFMALTLSTMGFSPSEVLGQVITIDSPAPNSTVNVGPMSAPMEVKATIPSGYSVRNESGQVSYDGIDNTSYKAAEDPDFPAGSGHYIFYINIAPGTHSGCTVTVVAFEIANPAVSISKSHADVTVVKP